MGGGEEEEGCKSMDFPPSSNHGLNENINRLDLTSFSDAEKGRRGLFDPPKALMLSIKGPGRTKAIWDGGGL